MFIYKDITPFQSGKMVLLSTKNQIPFKIADNIDKNLLKENLSKDLPTGTKILSIRVLWRKIKVAGWRGQKRTKRKPSKVAIVTFNKNTSEIFKDNK